LAGYFFMMNSPSVLGVQSARSKTLSMGARFSVHETTLHVGSLLPEHEGLRIAHVSDIHIGAFTPSKRIRSAVERINELAPDLVFLTGDYVTWAKGPVARVCSLLEGLESPTFCVLGNHDHWVDPLGVRAQLERANYTVMQNEHRTLTVRERALHLIGVDDLRSGNANVERAMSEVPRLGGTRLALAHVPNTADLLPADAGIACFSGHTHGGQVRVGSLTDRAAKVFGHPYLRGSHHVQGNSLYVTSGLAYGRGSILPRFRCPPEISLVTLTR
jgi:uncharacterized protein